MAADGSQKMGVEIKGASQEGDDPSLRALDDLEASPGEKPIDTAIGSVEDVYTIDSDNSPFPEVRANVPNTDDPSMPVNTLRMWLVGIIFTMVGTGINQFFSMRYPSVTISSLVAQLLAFPVGTALARILPVKTVRLFGRWDVTINPDHYFNIKEHCVVTIMSNLAFGPSWATDIIQAQVAPTFFDMKNPVSYQFLLGLTMQLFGLGMAGLSYRFIVEPPQMIWPSTLANAALFQTLHSRLNPPADGWKISRYRFFAIVFCASFCWVGSIESHIFFAHADVDTVLAPRLPFHGP